MNSPAKSSALKNIILVLLVSVVAVFLTMLLGEKLKKFSLTMKGFLRWAVQNDTTPLRKVVFELSSKAKGRKEASFVWTLAADDAPLLHELSTEQVGQVPCATSAVQIFPASEPRVME